MALDPFKLERSLSDIQSSDPFKLERKVFHGSPVDTEAEAEKEELRKEAARIAKEAISSGNDTDYDYTSALKHQKMTGDSMYDQESNKWYSRIPSGPMEGRILKSPLHPTYSMTVEDELALGNVIIRKGDHEYSVTPKEAEEYYESIYDEDAASGVIQDLVYGGGNVRNMQEFGSATGDWSGTLADGTTTDSTWNKRTYWDKNREGLENHHTMGKITGSQIIAPIIEKLDFLPFDADMLTSATVGLSKSIAEQLAFHARYWSGGGEFKQDGLVGDMQEWAEWFSGLNIALNQSELLKPEGFLQEKTEMLTHSLLSSASGLVTGTATTLATRNPALGVKVGMATATASALSAGAGAAETRMDLIEEERNAILRLQGLEPDYRIPTAERNRIAYEHAVAEAGFELIGNAFALKIIGKAVGAAKKAGVDKKASSMFNTVSGRFAITKRMQDALTAQMQAQTDLGSVLRFVRGAAPTLPAEGLTEVATEIGQTLSISRVDEDAWENMDLWGTFADGMLLGAVLGGGLAPVQYYGQTIIENQRLAELDGLLPTLESRSDNSVEFWARHHPEEVETLQGMSEEEREQRAAETDSNIQELENQMRQLEKEILAEEQSVEPDALTIARKQQEKRNLYTEIGRLETLRAMVMDVQLGQGDKGVTKTKLTPEAVVERTAKAKGTKAKISKPKTKAEKKAAERLKALGYEVVFVEGHVQGDRVIPAFYDPSTAGTIYISNDSALHWTNLFSLGVHEIVHDIQYYDPVLYKALKDALGSAEVLLSAAQYIDAAPLDKDGKIESYEDQQGQDLIAHLLNGGTLESFTGDAETAVTYIEQEGMAVAIEQGGQQGRITRLLQRLGLGTNRGKANATLLSVLQKSAARVKARRESDTAPPLSEFGARQGKVDRIKKSLEVAEAEVAEARSLIGSKDLWSMPKQEITSAETSQAQVPALHKDDRVKLEKGFVSADIGGGKYDLATEYLLKEHGVTNYVIDPFNRTAEENKKAIAKVKDGQADVALVANTLNVIKEKEARRRVIAQAANVIKQDGTAYFSTYEKEGFGKGEKTTKGWQNQRKTETYVPEIEEFFGNVERKGMLIIATQPLEARKIDVKAAAQASLQQRMKAASPTEYLKNIAMNSKTEMLANISPKDFAIKKGEVGFLQVFTLPSIDVGYALRKTEDGYEITGVYNRESNVNEIMQSVISHAQSIAGNEEVTISGVNPEETQNFAQAKEEGVVYSLEDMKSNLESQTKGKGPKALGKKLSVVNLLPKEQYYENIKKVEELENAIPEIDESKKRIIRYSILHRGLQSRKDSGARKAAKQLDKEKKNLAKLRKELWSDEINALNESIAQERERLMNDNLGLPIVRIKDGTVGANQHANVVVQARFDTHAQSILGIVDESAVPDRVEKIMANAVAEELVWASLHDSDFGQNWYKDNIAGMWHWIGKTEPTLTDRNSEDGIHFSLLISLLSDGEKIQNNIRLSLDVYRHFNIHHTYKTGAKHRAAGYWKLEALLNHFGTWKSVDEWLQKEGTVSEINEELLEMSKVDERFADMLIKGESVKESVWKAFVLGPKLGAFYLNNRGNYEPLTQDVWFTRSIYRLMGLLELPQTTAERNRVNRLSEIVELIENGTPLNKAYSKKAELESSQKALEKVKPESFGTPELAGFEPSMLESVDSLMSWVKTASSEYTAMGYPHSKESATAAFEKKVKAGTAEYISHSAKLMYTIANGWSKSQAKGVEAPSGAEGRARARRVIRNGIEIYKNRTGNTDINNASAQAMLWYNEKELYHVYTGSETPFGQDYETGARELYNQEVLLRDPNATLEARKLGDRTFETGGGTLESLTTKVGPASYYPKAFSVLNSIRQPSMKGKDLRKFLEGKGVNKEELFFTGLDAFIESKGDESIPIEDAINAIQEIALRSSVQSRWGHYIPNIFSDGMYDEYGEFETQNYNEYLVNWIPLPNQQVQKDDNYKFDPTGGNPEAKALLYFLEEMYSESSDGLPEVGGVGDFGVGSTMAKDLFKDLQRLSLGSIKSTGRSVRYILLLKHLALKGLDAKISGLTQLKSETDPFDGTTTHNVLEQELALAELQKATLGLILPEVSSRFEKEGSALWEHMAHQQGIVGREQYDQSLYLSELDAYSMVHIHDYLDRQEGLDLEDVNRNELALSKADEGFGNLVQKVVDKQGVAYDQAADTSGHVGIDTSDANSNIPFSSSRKRLLPNASLPPMTSRNYISRFTQHMPSGIAHMLFDLFRDGHLNLESVYELTEDTHAGIDLFGAIKIDWLKSAESGTLLTTAATEINDKLRKHYDKDMDNESSVGLHSSPSGNIDGDFESIINMPYNLEKDSRQVFLEWQRTGEEFALLPDATRYLWQESGSVTVAGSDFQSPHWSGDLGKNNLGWVRALEWKAFDILNKEDVSILFCNEFQSDAVNAAVGSKGFFTGDVVTSYFDPQRLRHMHTQHLLKDKVLDDTNYSIITPSQLENPKTIETVTLEDYSDVEEAITLVARLTGKGGIEPTTSQDSMSEIIPSHAMGEYTVGVGEHGMDNVHSIEAPPLFNTVDKNPSDALNEQLDFLLSLTPFQRYLYTEWADRYFQRPDSSILYVHNYEYTLPDGKAISLHHKEYDILRNVDSQEPFVLHTDSSMGEEWQSHILSTKEKKDAGRRMLEEIVGRHATWQEIESAIDNKVDKLTAEEVEKQLETTRLKTDFEFPASVKNRLTEEAKVDLQEQYLRSALKRRLFESVQAELPYSVTFQRGQEEMALDFLKKFDDLFSTEDKRNLIAKELLDGGASTWSATKAIMTNLVYWLKGGMSVEDITGYSDWSPLALKLISGEHSYQTENQTNHENYAEVEFTRWKDSKLSGPPRMPFVSKESGKVSDSWLGLMLKRMIAEAASKGLDGIGITTREFANTTDGIALGEEYMGYSKLASMLKKIGKKLDPDAMFVESIRETFINSTLSESYWEDLDFQKKLHNYSKDKQTPDGAYLQITDKIKEAVEKGMPLFGNTAIEARRDVGLRINSASSKLRVTDDEIHTGLADLIDVIPIDDFFLANKSEWLRGFWNEEIEPLVLDYVHGLEIAYNAQIIGRAEQVPTDAEAVDVNLYEVPYNQYKEASDLFVGEPNTDSTPAMTLLKLGTQFRKMWQELGTGSDKDAMVRHATGAVQHLNALGHLMFNVLGSRSDVYTREDLSYFLDVKQRATGQVDIRDESGALVQESAGKKAIIQILFEDTSLEARRLNGSKRLVSVTAVREENMNDILDIGALVMPSVATVKADDYAPFFSSMWTFGDTFFVYNPDAVRPEKSPTFTGDIYSVRGKDIGLQRIGGELMIKDTSKSLIPEYTKATVEDYLLAKMMLQANRGGIRGSEVNIPRATGIAVGLLRSIVVDEVYTTEDAREGLSRLMATSEGQLEDMQHRHKKTWRSIVQAIREKSPDVSKGFIQKEIYKSIRDYFDNNEVRSRQGETYQMHLLTNKESFINFVTEGLSDSNYQVPENTIENLYDLMLDLSTSEVPYFESKPQRSVPFGKDGVVAALVPMRFSEAVGFETPSDVASYIERLEEKGVQVVRYDENNLLDFQEKLQDLEDSVLYARNLPARRTSILASPALGMMMRDEEELKGVTAADKTPFEQGFKAGARAGVKMQKERSKEERKYAVETERERARVRETRKLQQQRELLERRIERVKAKVADAEVLREAAITVVKMLSKKDRGDLAIRLARVTSDKKLTELVERAIELAAITELRNSRTRLRKVAKTLKKRKLGMTTTTRSLVEGMLNAADALVPRKLSKKGRMILDTSVGAAELVNRAREMERLIEEAITLVKEVTLEYRTSREDRKGRLSEIAINLTNALTGHKSRPMSWLGKHRNRKSKLVFSKSMTTLSMVELMVQHAPAEVQKSIVDILHYNIADSESAHLSEIRNVLEELDRLAKLAGFNSLDSMLDIIGTTDIEAVTETVDVTIGGEVVRITLDNLMKFVATDPETVDLIVDELDSSGEVIKKGVGIKFAGGEDADTVHITRDEWHVMVASASKELRDFIGAAKAIREALRGPAFKAYFDIHGTEPKAVVGYEPRRRVETAQQKLDKLDVPSVTGGFIDEAGLTIERVAGGQPVVIGGFVQDFLSSVEALSKITHMAIPLRDAISIINQEEVLSALNKHLGAEFAVNLMNRLKHATGLVEREESGLLMRTSGGASRAYITANPSTWLRVLFGGIANLTIKLPASDVLIGLSSLTNVKSNLQEAWTNGYLYARSRSGAMRRQTQEAEQTIGRIADQNALMSSVVKSAKSLARAAQYLINGDIRASWNPIKDVLAEIYRLPDSIHVLQAMDNLVTAVAYGAYKSKYRAEGLTGSELIEASAKAAERIMRETQNTSSAIDATVLDADDAVRRKRMPLRSFFPFVSDPITKANAYYRALKFGNKRDKRIAAQGFVTTVATNIGVTYGFAMMLQLLSDLFSDDEPDYYNEQVREIVKQANEKKAFEQSISGAVDDFLSTFGYAGVMASWAMSIFEGYDAGIPALWAGVAEDVGRDLKLLIAEQSKEEPDEEKIKDYIARLTDTLRIAAGDPTVIPAKTYEKLEGMIEPSLKDVEKALRTLKRESPLGRMLGIDAESLTRAQERAIAKFKSRKERENRMEERRNRMATEPQP